MPYPREVLNRLRWQGGLEEAIVTYLHRGAPGDKVTVRGKDIMELGRSFFTTAEATIPYHRIRLIERGDNVLYHYMEEK
jgi:uncharacterized protein